MLEEITEKKCTTCGEIKKIQFFNKVGNGKTGFRSKCKDCNNKNYNKNKEEIKKIQKQYYEDNKEIINKQRKKYRELNKEKIANSKKEFQLKNKEKIAKYQKIYREINKEKKSKNYKEYYIRNKEILLKKKREYYKTPNGKSVILNIIHKRRTIKNQGDVTTKQLLELQQNAKVCYWCNQPLKNKKVHIDHYVPLAKGGDHTISNLVVSCDKCNITKSAKDPIVFAQSIGKLL